MSEKIKTVENSKLQGCFGKHCKSSEVVEWIVELCEDNFARNDKGRWSGSIWGTAGIGKTSLTKSFGDFPIVYNGKKHNGFKIVVVPLAQIEEMGDILGLPEDYIELEKDGKKEYVIVNDVILNYYVNNGWKPVLGSRPTMNYSPPPWVPKEEGPGIIIFDDGNRASSRIGKGMMQLVQDYKTIGWGIPAGWTILFTGNPDNNQYSVTTMDEAQITRQRHITMIADAKEWAIWADGEKIDGRCINFVLKYPEIIDGAERTNLRTLTEFFKIIGKYNSFKNKETLKKIMLHAESLLDKETVGVFSTYIQRDLELLFEPIDVFDKLDDVLGTIKKWVEYKEPRVDLLSVVCDRLVSYLYNNDLDLTPERIECFQKFAMSPNLPNDLAHSMLSRVVRLKKTNLLKLVTGNSELNAFICGMMKLKL